MIDEIANLGCTMDDLNMGEELFVPSFAHIGR